MNVICKNYSGRTLILKNYYYIMCIITQIVVPIAPKFVFLSTKFGKPGRHLYLLIPEMACSYQESWQYSYT